MTQGLEAALERQKHARSKPRVLDGDGEARLVALMCSEPPPGQSRWTLRLLRHRLVEEDFAGAKRITLVMDNLSTHCGASLYKAFEPEAARRLLDRLEFVYTPKQGSWLNMSECEFSVLLRQCLNRRLPDIDRVRSEVNAWVEVRNRVGNTTHWRFTTEDARIKLRSLYPAKLN